MIHRKAAAAAATILMSTAGLVTATAGPAQANTCSVTPKAGVSSVSIRGNKSVNGTPDFYLRAGEWISTSCHSESGGYYSSCGGGDHWFFVFSGILSRYVAASCVRLVVDRG
jgi:hypothetical protein